MACICLMFPLFAESQNAHAMTVYESDGQEYDEGYIILGESHACLSSELFSKHVDENDHVEGLDGVVYHFVWDDSKAVDQDGVPNTFIMSGNLFFVFEGIAQADGHTQTSKEFVYSDGKGKRGLGVQKIHDIMDANPKIKHWNILSNHGSMSALRGAELVPEYIADYNNWMNYEFPHASIYLLSHSTMTQYYKQNKKAYLFDEGLKEAFPDIFYDYTEYYESRYPEHTIDPVHWDGGTYLNMFSEVIRDMQSHCGNSCEARFYGEEIEL